MIFVNWSVLMVSRLRVSRFFDAVVRVRGPAPAAVFVPGAPLRVTLGVRLLYRTRLAARTLVTYDS